MKTIPIQIDTPMFSECEESGVVPKQNLPLARREFLKGLLKTHVLPMASFVWEQRHFLRIH